MFNVAYSAKYVCVEKETKALRKKVKRQEIANRAAEKELAEISLEQQVLRELRAKQTQKPGETQAASQASTSVPSTQDLTTTAVSSATATCAMSQPAIVANWTSVGEKSQVRICCLHTNNTYTLCFTNRNWFLF